MPIELPVLVDPVGQGLSIAGYTVLTEVFDTQGEVDARIAEIRGGGVIVNGEALDPSRLGYLIWPSTQNRSEEDQ